MCVKDTETCAIAEAEGRFELRAPQGPLVLVASDEQYRSSALSLNLGDASIVDLPLISKLSWDAEQSAFGVGDDAGMLALFIGKGGDAQPAPLPGASVNLEGNGYSGIGALYDPTGAPRREGQTSQDGLALFLDLEPGRYMTLANHPGGACFPVLGMEGDSLNLEVWEEHITLVTFSCLVDVQSSVEVQGVISVYASSLTIPGADVCLELSGESSTCVETSPSGVFFFDDVTPGASAVLTVSAQGFMPTRLEFNTSVALVANQELTPLELPRVDLEEPPDYSLSGNLVIRAYDIASVVEGAYHSATTQDGVSFSIFPEAGLGPYYQLEPGFYSAGVPATYGSGEALVYGLPEGIYTARFDHPWGPCTPGYGKDFNAESRTFTFEVVAGVETRLVGECAVLPPDSVNIIGKVYDGADSKTPIAGAEVCLEEFAAAERDQTAFASCAMSDEYGAYEVKGVPAHTLMWLSTSAEDYRSGRTLVDTQSGLTYHPELSSLVLEQLFYGPLVDLGVCEDVADVATLDGKYAFFASRAYDASYNSESFFQGLSLDRVRMTLTHVATGEVHGSTSPWKHKMLFGEGGGPNPRLEETTPNGLGVWCDLVVGDEYRMTYTHPFGTCTVAQGLPPDSEDGGYTFRVYSGESFGFVAQCEIDPPGTLHEEMIADPELSAMKTLLDSSGLFDYFSLASETPYWDPAYDRITVLAPTSEALSAYLDETGELSPGFALGLAAHHVIYGELELDDLVRPEPHWGLAGRPISFVEGDNGEIRIEGTDVTLTPYEHWTLDGIVYHLDGVMDLPELPESNVQSVDTEVATAELIGGSQRTSEGWESGVVQYPSYTVYTPRGYYEQWPSGYPVLYVLHDVGGDDSHIFKGSLAGQALGSSLGEVLDAVFSGEDVEPMIVVAINGLNDGFGSYFVDSKLSDGSTAFGDFQAYLLAIIDEVEASYNVAAEPGMPSNRALLGIGMGGFGAIHAAASFPYFGAVAVHSGLLSISNLLAADPVVAAQYPDESIDGSLGSEFLAAWSAIYGTPILDGRLVELIGPGAPEVIARVAAMASAFTPRQGMLYDFDMMATSPFFSGLAPPDDDWANNRDYPVKLSDKGEDLDSDIDDLYLGFRLPWQANGELDPEVWAGWEAFEPIDAMSANASALLAAGTRFFIDCGLANERGFADQAEAFAAAASELLGAERVSLELYEGDHDSLIYSTRLYTSLIWIDAALSSDAP